MKLQRDAANQLLRADKYSWDIQQTAQHRHTWRIRMTESLRDNQTAQPLNVTFRYAN